ncbi:hypothetical protein [Actinacidiphila sp. ITFR-21]|uniref:hypothetical protein n=1 Tax=Actinacidiphila sp. ITFR-21 TaxID=3075199 RepID=UPI00288B4113|nr:hypothetical protein [Streptomyces sp. ITFR-21]WNI20371.1 hypothetical protein RLT57_32730 [Streptomyces sp. ITFR-21]
MNDDDFDALTREHFARPEIAAQMTADLLAARRAAERPEPPPVTTMPMPEFLRTRIAGQIARYRCPRGCGWFHDEPTDPGPLGLIVAIEPGQDSIGEMISLNAEARSLAYQARVEAAIDEHYAESH